MNNALIVCKLVFAYGMLSWVALAFSVWVVNRFWVDPLDDIRINTNTYKINNVTALQGKQTRHNRQRKHQRAA